MKIRQLAASTAIILGLTTSTVFATPGEATPKNEEHQIRQKHGHRDHAKFEKDPIKALECKKERVLKLYQDGKLTKEKADEIVAKIDNKILEIKDFQKLPLDQKKEKLLKDCETRLNEMVKNGKMDQKTAEDKFKDYVEKINSWDGTGYPRFHGKRMHEKH